MQRQLLLSLNMDEQDVEKVLNETSLDELKLELVAIRQIIDNVTAIQRLEEQLKASKKMYRQQEEKIKKHGASKLVIDAQVVREKDNNFNEVKLRNLKLDSHYLPEHLDILNEFENKLLAAVATKESLRKQDEDADRQRLIQASIDATRENAKNVEQTKLDKDAKMKVEAAASDRQVMLPSIVEQPENAVSSRQQLYITLEKFKEKNPRSNDLYEAGKTLADLFESTTPDDYDHRVLVAAGNIVANNTPANQAAFQSLMKAPEYEKRNKAKLYGGILIAFLGAAIVAAGIALAVTLIGFPLAAPVIAAGLIVGAFGVYFALDSKPRDNQKQKHQAAENFYTLFSKKNNVNAASVPDMRPTPVVTY